MIWLTIVTPSLCPNHEFISSILSYQTWTELSDRSGQLSNYLLAEDLLKVIETGVRSEGRSRGQVLEGGGG